MSTIGRSFFDYAMKESVDLAKREWLEKIFADFNDIPQCKSCGSSSVDIIIDPQTAMKCKRCGQWSEGITLDKVRPIDYNAVIIQKKDILMNILKAQEEI